MIVLRESVKLVNRINRADKSVSAEGRTSVSSSEKRSAIEAGGISQLCPREVGKMFSSWKKDVPRLLCCCQWSLQAYCVLLCVISKVIFLDYYFIISIQRNRFPYDMFIHTLF